MGVDSMGVQLDPSAAYVLEMKRRSAKYLLIGGSFGAIGMLFVTFLGIHRVHSDQGVNINGQPYPSGYIYFPFCVSEMVHDPITPVGKIFHAFMCIAAVCILLSWFPYELGNCDLGEARPLQRCCRLLPIWNDFRQFVPPLGLLLVALIASTPEGLQGTRERIAENVHAYGAMAAVGVNAAIEMYTLLIRNPRQGKVVGLERRVRLVMVCISIGFGVAFALLNQVWSHLDDFGMCCRDVWAEPNSTNADLAMLAGKNNTMMLDWQRAQINKRMLVDTASGAGFVMKHLVYWSEVLSCLFFAFNLLAIWWFCLERHPPKANDQPLLATGDDSSDSGE